MWTYISLSDLTTASFYSDILAADQTRAMQEQMQMQMQMPQDPSKAFKAEWEALEIVTHEWSLENVEHEMMEEFAPADIDVIAKDKYV